MAAGSLDFGHAVFQHVLLGVKTVPFPCDATPPHPLVTKLRCSPPSVVRRPPWVLLLPGRAHQLVRREQCRGRGAPKRGFLREREAFASRWYGDGLTAARRNPKGDAGCRGFCAFLVPFAPALFNRMGRAALRPAVDCSPSQCHGVSSSIPCDLVGIGPAEGWLAVLANG